MMETELVNIIIDGHDLQVPKGEKIIESAKRVGVEVPFFCYHPRLSMEDGGANCRMCLVELSMPGPDGVVRKQQKPQTACSLPASEGMEIVTESEPLIQDRKGILEFLLINHPLDCPICDRGGECPLQNNALHYGPPTTRYIEEKRHFPKAYPLSQHVVFDRERCIHCARCTRFTTDISGDAQLNFLKRGADMEVGTFEHTSYDSRFSGNVIELCPVGALLSRNYRFKARPWDLLTERSICTQCSNGCNIKLDYRVNSIQRVNARLNEDVNEEWTCDKGKFGMGDVSAENRLKEPLLKRNGRFEPISWDEANKVLTQKLKDAGSAVGGIGGARSSNEDLYSFQKLFRETLGSNNLDHRMGPNFPATNSSLFQRLGYHTMGNSIAELEKMKTIFVIGGDLADEQPILFLRVRKGWRFNGASVVEANSSENGVSEFASLSLRHRPGTEVALINGLIHIIVNDDFLPKAQLSKLVDFTKFKSSSAIALAIPERTAQDTDVPVDALRRAASLLATEGAAIIAGSAVSNHSQSEDVENALMNLAVLTGNVGNLNIPVNLNNQQGAMDMGILPDVAPGYQALERAGMNTEQMLRAAADGELKALWIVGADVVNDFHNPDHARKALENCPFVVVNELFLTETAEYADLVLPVQSVAERDGTYTSTERRVQRFFKAFELAPTIRPDWIVFAEVGNRLSGASIFFSFKDILDEINENVPLYGECSLQSIGDQGIRWSYHEAAAKPNTLIQVDYKHSEALGAAR